MKNTNTDELYDWWTSLKHGGLLIAPSKLASYFSAEMPTHSRHLSGRLRRAVIRSLDGDPKHLSTLLDTVLEDLLGLKRSQWKKGSDVDASWSQRAITREVIKPRRVWKGANGAVLPVFVGDASSGSRGQNGTAFRIGVGRGRRSASRVVEWLRRADQKVALLTNGRQWRLIHAGADYDAWCEWDTDLWFQEGQPGDQVTALCLLLGIDALQPEKEEEQSRLVAAILDSRRGQAELSTVLGERVRQAVEDVIQASRESLSRLERIGPTSVSNHDIYIGATRIIMRCVVILFAEARDLLPRDNVIYNESYGLQRLREQLDRLAGGRSAERLRHTQSAWPRLMSLFKLVYEGSAHESLPIPRYGSALFQPGDPTSSDPILRALAAFEDVSNVPSDAVVHRILELLTRGKVKVRQGNRNVRVEAPVDFSDLSSEYIGILYEGLLDFELHQAGDGEPVIFVNVGEQPALPFDRLNSMSNKDLADLLEKLKKSTKDSDAEDGEDEIESEEVEEVDEAEDEAPEKEALVIEDEESDEKRVLYEMVQDWAERAVKAAKLVKYPKDDTDPVVREAFNQEVTQVGRGLIRRVVMPGEWYLTRWGGTRKGSGTFYTRPQLAEPTVRRTLQPLVYEPVSEQKDKETGLATVTDWKPKTPEDILALKVCDPAMGSGSFVVSSLRFLVDALLASLYYYERFESDPERTICKLADGLPVDHPSQETLPIPKDRPEFDDYLRARLKRHVVERCIYGVDLDPLAVELARMALWVETMDPALPFGFLDHKLKCGNSLVGCWFDRFQDYPAMAWDREGGDKNHERFVHHFHDQIITRGKNKGKTTRKGDKWTQAIKEKKSDIVKPQLIALAESQKRYDFPFDDEETASDSLHDEALAAFQELHDLPIHETEKRAELYREKIIENKHYQRLKEAFDTWTALWFWPSDQLGLAPTPSGFLTPSEEALKMVSKLHGIHRFFHWELEFPDVFTASEAGFNGILGNPPWDIQKPNSKEFFSRIDPLYRTYEGQKSRAIQEEYFGRNPQTERQWVEYRAKFNALSNWTKYVGFPFGDRVTTDSKGKKRHDFNLGSGGKNSYQVSQHRHDLLAKWRVDRASYSDPDHPFIYQGSADINTYKMFVETSYGLLKPRGHLGFVVPSAIYSDKGSTELRKLLIDSSNLRWVFGFENSKKLFPIDSRFRFCCILAEKQAETDIVVTAFGSVDYTNWQAKSPDILPVKKGNLHLFSPQSRAVLEVESRRDLEVLKKVYAEAHMLGEMDSGWSILYNREFDMTNKRHLFLTLERAESKGAKQLGPGFWEIEGEQFVCFYTGKLIGQFDFAYQEWVSGHGNTANWKLVSFSDKIWYPEFVMPTKNAAHVWEGGIRLSFRDIARSTDESTMIAAVIPAWPCGNKVPLLYEEDSVSLNQILSLCGVLNSFAYNFAVRTRLTGINLNKFIVYETPVPHPSKLPDILPVLVAQLTLCHEVFAPSWIELAHHYPELKTRPWRSWWALSDSERVRIRSVVEAIVAQSYELDSETALQDIVSCDKGDFAWILNPDENRPKGFWRTDRDKPFSARLTTLSLQAFATLKEKGLENYSSNACVDWWQLPEDVTRHFKRFVDDAEDVNPRESWEECEEFATQIRELWCGGEVTPKFRKKKNHSTQLNLFGN